MLSKRLGLWILLFLCAFSAHLHAQLPEYEVICVFDDDAYQQVANASILESRAQRGDLQSMNASDVRDARRAIHDAMESAFAQVKRESGFDAAVNESFAAMSIQKDASGAETVDGVLFQSFDVESAGAFVVQGSLAATKMFEEKVKSIPNLEVRHQGRIQVFGKDDVTPMANGSFWGVTKIGADKVWPQCTGNGITVGVIDTGIMRNHPAFKSGSILAGYNAINPGVAFDDNDLVHHGTHVAGIIAGQNGMGVAPDAKIFPVLALGSGATLAGTLLRAIEVAIDNNVDIINMSLGATGDPVNSGSFDRAFARANDKNICVVVAAGNYPLNPAVAGDDGSVSYPGRHNNVITVGAVDQFDNSPAFSRPINNNVAQKYRGKPQLSAPGVGIMSAGSQNGNTNTLQGTSQAAPHVAGAMALMKQKNRGLTHNQILDALTGTVATGTRDVRRGAGRIDVEKAIRFISGGGGGGGGNSGRPCDDARIARLESVLDFWKRKNQQPIPTGYGFGMPFMGGVAMPALGVGQIPVLARPAPNTQVQLTAGAIEELLDSSADTRSEVLNLTKSLEQLRADVDSLKNLPPAPDPAPDPSPVP